jgi:hypothetical protein
MATMTDHDLDTAPVAADGPGAPAADGGSTAPAGRTGGATRPARRAPGIGPLMGGLAGFTGLLIGLAPLHDNSTFTHLATGRLILERGGVPRTDPYSFTAHGDPWVVQSWLASVLYAGAEELAGFGGVRLLNGLICAAIGVCVWLLTSRSPSLVVRGGVSLVALVVAGEMMAGRPLLFGTLGLALAFLAADGRFDPRWLLPVGWVWVNTHGSFPFALVLIGALAVGHRLDEGSWGREIRVGAWMAGGIALGALNPLGVQLLLFPASVGTRTEAFKTMVEWSPPGYEAWAEYAVLALLLGAAALLVRNPRWRDAVPLVVFGALALTAMRNQLPLLIVLVPILAGSLPAVGPDVASIRRPIFRQAAVALAAVVVLFTVAVLGQPDVELDAYPEDAMVWMEEQGMWGPDSRVIAPDYVGNLRGAQAGEDARAFIDDRVDMYPVDVVMDYKALLFTEPDWSEVLDSYEPTAVLWKDDQPLAYALSQDPDWELVHEDSPWVVYVPASSR